MTRRWLRRKCRLFVLAFTCGLFLLAAVSQASPEEFGRVTVSVKDPGGAALGRARLSFTATDSSGRQIIEAEIGPNGAASLDLPVGSYELSVTSDGFLPAKQTVTVDEQSKQSFVVALQMNNVRTDRMGMDNDPANHLELEASSLDDIWVPVDPSCSFPCM